MNEWMNEQANLNSSQQFRLSTTCPKATFLDFLSWLPYMNLTLQPDAVFFWLRCFLLLESAQLHGVLFTEVTMWKQLCDPVAPLKTPGLRPPLPQSSPWALHPEVTLPPLRDDSPRAHRIMSLLHMFAYILSTLLYTKIEAKPCLKLFICHQGLTQLPGHMPSKCNGHPIFQHNSDTIVYIL